MKTCFSVMLFSLLFFALSCHKNEPEAQQKETRLSKITGTPHTFTYAYNEAGKMISEKINLTASGDLIATTTFSYNGQGQLEEYNTDFVLPTSTDRQGVIEYNTDGKISTITGANISASIGGVGRIKYTYAPGSFTEQLYNVTANLLRKSVFTLTADGKNISGIKHYNKLDELQEAVDYNGIDNTKKSHFTLYPYGFYTKQHFENTYGSVTYTTPGSSPETNIFSYEYNNDGYPVKRIYPTGYTVTYEYTYH